MIGGEGVISSRTGSPSDPVEDYLDQLLTSLSGSPRQVRHTLAEVEAHLRDAVAEGMAEGMADGLPEPDAQAWAPSSTASGQGNRSASGSPPRPQPRPSASPF
jgi:hypothetical protein